MSRFKGRKYQNILSNTAHNLITEDMDFFKNVDLGEKGPNVTRVMLEKVIYYTVEFQFLGVYLKGDGYFKPLHSTYIITYIYIYSGEYEFTFTQNEI